MLKGLLYSGLAAAALTGAMAPTLALADPSCHAQKNESRAVGTVVGAVGGAFLGNALGHGGGREGGTIIGGVGGAVAGNLVGGAAVNCSSNRYGYYDDNGRWIPNTVTENGYYDANGRWVETPLQGPPPSYGAPPPAYYGQDNSYSPPPPASYGYGQDRPNERYGYPTPESRGQDRDAAYAGDHGAGASMDTRAREDWLQTRIQQRIADGELSDRRGRHALRELDDIRRMDADYREADGHLNHDQRRDIEARLDTLRAGLGADRDQADARARD